MRLNGAKAGAEGDLAITVVSPTPTRGAAELGRLLPLLDRFDFWFEIVAP